VTAIAPCVQAFFTERLAQRQSSPNTVAAYRDALRLLVCYVHQTTGIEPSRLDFADLDADRIGAFLNHLEAVRHVSASTRKAGGETPELSPSTLTGRDVGRPARRAWVRTPPGGRRR